MTNIEKVNGLHSGTKFYERIEGLDRIEYHEHPETHELVVIEDRVVEGAGGCIDQEFEVTAVYPPDICKVSKAIEKCRQHIEVSCDEFIKSLKESRNIKS